MKASKIFAFLFGILGTALMLLTVALSLTSLNGTVWMDEVPAEATACTQQLMDALADGDYPTAEQLFYGDTRLGDPREASTELGKQVWIAFADSISYEFNGDCYTSSKGLSRDVTVTAMDLSTFFDPMYSQAQSILDEKEAAAKEAENVGLVFRDGKVLDSVMEEIVDTVVTDALTGETKTVTTTVTLELVNKDGRWQVMPNEALLKAISGGL